MTEPELQLDGVDPRLISYIVDRFGRFVDKFGNGTAPTRNVAVDGDIMKTVERQKNELSMAKEKHKIDTDMATEKHETEMSVKNMEIEFLKAKHELEMLGLRQTIYEKEQTVHAQQLEIKEITESFRKANHKIVTDQSVSKGTQADLDATKIKLSAVESELSTVRASVLEANTRANTTPQRPPTVPRMDNTLRRESVTNRISSALEHKAAETSTGVNQAIANGRQVRESPLRESMLQNRDNVRDQRKRPRLSEEPSQTLSSPHLRDSYGSRGGAFRASRGR